MQDRGKRELNVKSVSDSGEFEMYAAIFDVVDLTNEIIKQNAFTNLDEFIRSGWVAFNHQNYDLAVGYPVSATQDSVGLKVVGKFHSTSSAQSLRTVVTERLNAQKAVKASIGYRILDESTENIGGRRVRVLTKLELLEVSFVNLPANPLAEVVSAKQLVSAKEALEIIKQFKHKKLTDKQIDSLKSWLEQAGEFERVFKEAKGLLDEYTKDESYDRSLAVVAEAAEVAARHGLTIF